MGINYIERKSIDDAFDLRRFVWSGAKDRVKDLTDEQCELLVRHLEDVFEGETEVEDTTINDYVWFESDEWEKAIGIEEDEDEDEEDEEEEEEDEEEE